MINTIICYIMYTEPLFISLLKMSLAVIIFTVALTLSCLVVGVVVDICSKIISRCRRRCGRSSIEPMEIWGTITPENPVHKLDERTRPRSSEGIGT